MRGKKKQVENLKMSVLAYPRADISEPLSLSLNLRPEACKTNTWPSWEPSCLVGRYIKVAKGRLQLQACHTLALSSSFMLVDMMQIIIMFGSYSSAVSYSGIVCSSFRFLFQYQKLI